MRNSIPAQAIKQIQLELRKNGLYDGNIDGERTVANGRSKTDIGIEKALSTRQSELVLKPNEQSYLNWTDKRRATGYLQLLLGDAKFDPGPADGFWGPTTDAAYDLMSGNMDRNWRADQDSKLIKPPASRLIQPVRNNWPGQNTSSLTSFYGPACSVPLVRVEVPWTMKLAWDKNTRVSSVSIHEKNAESLTRIFGQVSNTYSTREINEFGLNLFGGSYNCRKIRGGDRMSTHSWGIALDFDPERNQLRWGANKAFLARPELEPFWEIWEREGWSSLGREKNYDWMHVQAADI